MKAACFAGHGGPEKIIFGDYQDPAAGTGEVVVRVKACALNHVDLLLLDGRFPPPQGLPHVNGCEVTGTVEALGPDVSNVNQGQRVIVFPGFACGRCEYCMRGERTVCLSYGYLGAHRDGGYAELVKVPAENLLPLADQVSFEAGAAVPLAIQIARIIGARVIATVGSDDKVEFAHAIGAEAVVNYRSHDFVDEVRKWTNRRGVDVVVEHIGAETFEHSIYCLTRLGTLVSIGSHGSHWGRMDLRHVYSKNLRILGTNLGSITELRTLIEFVAAGSLKPVVDRVFPLSETRTAVQYLAERRNRGKVVLAP